MNDRSDPASIRICMGSSCYARGNRDNVEIIQRYLTENGLAARVELKGELCHKNCQEGPIVAINGKVFRDVRPVAMRDILDQIFGRP
jgi:NADH:ubiquinone oxidoreductase subunit E